MKKIIAILLAILLVVPFAFQAFAETNIITTTYSCGDSTSNGTLVASSGSDSTKYYTQNSNGYFLRINIDGTNGAEGLYGTAVINVEEAGEYDIVLTLRAHESCGVCDVYLNDSTEKLVTADMRAGSLYGSNVKFELSAGKATLKEGENVFKFVSTGEGGSNSAANYRYNANVYSIAISKEASYVPFSAGSITAEEQAVITQQIEEGYTFDGVVLDSNNNDTTNAPSFSKSSTGGYGGDIHIAYSIKTGSTFSYTVNVAEAGDYTVEYLSRLHANGWGEFQLLVDGNEYGSFKNIYESSYGEKYYELYNLGTVALTEGDHTITLKAIGSGACAYGKENNNCLGGDYFSLTKVVSNYTITSDDFSAFMSSRATDTDGYHDLRVIIAANLEGLDAYEALYMTVEFYDSDGNKVKSLTKNVVTELQIFASATAAGNTYTAGEGSVLTGCVITGIPDSDWASVQVSLSQEAAGEPFVKGTLSASTLIN